MQKKVIERSKERMQKKIIEGKNAKGRKKTMKMKRGRKEVCTKRMISKKWITIRNKHCFSYEERERERESTEGNQMKYICSRNIKTERGKLLYEVETREN